MLPRICVSMVLALCCCVCLYSPVHAEELTIEQALKLLEKQQKVGDTVVVTSYVVRHTEPSGTLEEEESKAVHRMQLTLDAARARRVLQDRAQGVETDVAALKADDAATVEEFRKRFRATFTGGVRTFAARVTVAGNKWRFEQMDLPNDRPVEEVVDLVQENGFRPITVESFNGDVYALIRRPFDPETFPYTNSSHVHGFTRFQKVTDPSILQLSEYKKSGAIGIRDVTDPVLTPELVAKLKGVLNLGYSFTVETSEDCLVVDGKGTVPLLGRSSQQLVYSITHGYALEQWVLKHEDAVVSDQKNQRFRQTDSGLWIAERMLRKLHNPRTGELRQSTEQIAFTPAQSEAQLPANFFNLAESKEFQTLSRDGSRGDELTTPTAK